MANFQVLTLPSHQLRVTGVVLNACTRAPVAQARVSVTGAPDSFSQRLSLKALQQGSRWESLEERPDRTRTAPDGTFFFMDLPAGDYTFSATLPQAGQRAGDISGAVTVVTSATRPVALELLLPPTALLGTVTTIGVDGQDSPVALARLRLDGSGEQVFSDADGQFLLDGIEPGERTLRITAQGFEASSQTVTLDRGEAHSLTVQLTVLTSS